MKFTPPITVHFLIHESYDKLHEVRKFLYSLLCRDSNNTNFDGLDIPVYFHIGSSNNIIPEICEVESEKRILFHSSMSICFVMMYGGDTLRT